MQLLKTPPAAFKWTKALDLTSKKQYSAAVTILDDIAPFFDQKSAEYHLLKGYLNFALAEDKIAVSEFQAALPLIQSNKKYTQQDKAYLTCYANLWAGKAQRQVTEEPGCEIGNFEGYDDICLPDVNSALRLSFPLRGHPNWPSNQRQV